MTTNVALGAVAILGAAVIVAAAPVAGLVIGAMTASNALLGGAAGLAIGAVALPLPISYLLSGASTADPEDANKHRLQRMAKEFGNIYKAVAGAIMSLLPSKPVPNEIHTPDDDWHVEDFGPYAGFGNGKVERDFSASAQKGAGGPVQSASPAISTSKPLIK